MKDSPELLEVARKRFLLWGYSATSMSTLAEDLGVTKAALYYHYRDKESLFLAVFEEYLEGVSADLGKLAGAFSLEEGTAHEAMKALARVFFRRGPESVAMDRLAFQETPHLSEAGQAILGEGYHRRLVAPLEACFSQAERRGWLRPRGEGEAGRVWLFMGLLSAWFAPGHAAVYDPGHETRPSGSRPWSRPLPPASSEPWLPGELEARVLAPLSFLPGLHAFCPPVYLRPGGNLCRQPTGGTPRIMRPSHQPFLAWKTGRR
jgi:AcrR family transcriptional regulator